MGQYGKAKTSYVNKKQEFPEINKIHFKKLFGKAERILNSKTAAYTSGEIYRIWKLACHFCLTDPHMLRIYDGRVIETFYSLIRLRSLGIPIPLLEGKTDFFNVELFLKPGVFIPRPETEELVELVISKIESKYKFSQNISILDMGTGTGAIALSLAKYFKGSYLTGIDISDRAITLAEKNRKLNGLKNATFIKKSFKDAGGWNKKFEVVVSNPPYISRYRGKFLPVEVVSWEPETALFGGPMGLKYYKEIIASLNNVLSKDGMFFLEIAPDLAEEVKSLCHENNYATQIYPDLNENLRFIHGKSL